MHEKKASAFNPFERPRRRIGEIMLENYYLSPDELEEVLDIQRSKPEQRLGYLCLKRGFASPTEVMDALMQQLRVAVPFSSR